MAVVLQNAKDLLRTLIRSIDKKVEYTLTVAEGERSGISVGLALGKRSTNVTIAADDLEAAVQSSMRRSQIRTTLKQAVDRMTFQSTPVASTRMLRAKTQTDGFFRPPQGARGGGGRR